MAQYFRLEAQRKAKDFQHWIGKKGGEKQGPIRGYNEALSQAKTMAQLTTEDIEITARDAAGEFVVGIFTSEEDISFSSNPLLKEAYEKSVTESLGLKDRLLSEFDPAMIDGMAKMAASLTYFANQYKKLEREPGGVGYKTLQKVYTNSTDFNFFKMPKSPVEMCWVFHSWEASDNIKVVTDFHGIGMPENSQLVKKTTPQFSILVDEKHLMLQLRPLAIGTLPNGNKFLAIIENAPNCRYEVSPANVVIVADEANLSDAINLVKSEFDRLNVYKNKIVFINEDSVVVKTKFDDTTWNDIVPLPFLQTEMEFLRNSVINHSLLVSEGLPLKRGVLISGAPGIGKSVSIKCLCNELAGKITIFVIEKVRSIRAIYELASTLSPCIILFEDLDLITENRQEEFYHNTKDNLMIDLLGVLSGSMEYQDIITIATTNHPEKIDAALAKRPGRFDIHIKVPPLDFETKESILRLYLNKYKVAPELIKEVVLSLKDSLSGYMLVGAHLEEYVKTSVKRAVVMKRPPELADFLESAEVLKSISDEMKRSQSIGFGGK